MSNDLISRRSIIEKLENALLNGDLTIGEQGLLSDIVSFVAIETTAYDIDKVVEELEENASRYTKKYNTPYGNNGYRDVKAISIHKTIEIVKNGGVSDDVCEWKYNYSEYYFESSCDHIHIFMYDGPKENEYGFCPYCGKKIKVVE